MNEKNMTADLWETYWSDENHHEWWKRPAPEVLEFIESQSSKERPNVLDLGCGLGRHAIAFAKAGFCVTATDASETAIAHLHEWVRKLGVSIRTETCDVLDDTLPTGTFDIVLSYNVIYHGYREQFAQAIEHARTLLRPGGLFFFTCPSRQDGKYGHGEQVAPHTFLCTKSITPGDIHYFADEADLDDLLGDFGQLSRKKDERYWNNKGVQQFYSYWQILAEKL
jgi:2-polyprenyl-3-methyl-5-hydroxy-6-metoxy-1,4-benzoquinol methylase